MISPYHGGTGTAVTSSVLTIIVFILPPAHTADFARHASAAAGAVQKPREKRPPVLGRFPCARFQADPRKWAVRCILCVDQKWAALKTGWVLKLMEIISGARFRRGCCVDQQTAEIGKRELHGQYLPVSASVSMRRTAVPRSMFPGSSRPTSSGIYLATIPESARVFSSASSTSCALPHSTALT